MMARASSVNLGNIVLSQAQKATCDTNQSIRNACSKTLHGGSDQINDCHSLEAGGEQGMTAEGCLLSFRD